MTTIEVYPSTLPGEPLERHQVDGGTLHDWLIRQCPSYRAGAQQPIAASVDGQVVPPEQWQALALTDQTVELRPNPRDGATALYIIAGVLLAPTVLKLFMPGMPSMANAQQGRQLQSASLQANTPRLNQVIPEIAGRFRVYPDYLCQPRRRFVDARTEAIDAMLCIGRGEFLIDPDEIYIGETPLSTLGDEVSYQIFGPGQAVTGHTAHQNWYNLPEVGSTRAGSGLRLIDEDPATPTGTPSTITGSAEPSLLYATTPVTWAVDGDSVTLNIDYADATELLAAIEAQLDPQRLAAVIDASGLLVISNRYPYSGQPLTLAGTTGATFGAAPVLVTGEITLGLWLGPFRLAPANEVAQQIEYDIFASSGLGRVEDSGAISERTRRIELQYRVAGGAWTSIYQDLTGASRDQMGWTFATSLPAAYGEVDVRMRRLGVESTDIKDLDRLEWYGMRCLLDSPASYAGVTTMAVTVRGSDRISTNTENKISLIATRKLGGTATWAIDDWVRYVCTSIGYSASDLDESELSALAAVWSARGDRFDHVVVDQTTVKDALATALRAGFAELTIDAGKIRPVRDQARTTFEHLYTPQNMVSALRRQFTAYDPDDYDGVDVEFTSSTTWEQETVQCRLPGDAGVRVEKIRLEGVTDRTRAWRIGMRQRRAHVYRRKTYTFSTEWDALNSRYLSYCAVSDDVPGYGQSAVLISTSSVTGGLLLRASEPLTWVTGASHVIALRRPDGTLSGPHAATRVDDYQVQIAGPLDFTPVTSGASDPTHLLFGTTTTWSYPVLITEISPSGDTVDVTAVNYDARVYADDDNSAPI